MGFPRANAGEEFRASAAGWNAAMDAAEDWLRRGRRTGGPTGFPTVDPCLTVWVRNDTGGSIPAHAARVARGGLGEVLTITDLEADVARAPYLAAGTDATEADDGAEARPVILVALEPIAAGGFGRCAFAGVVLATVYLSNRDHRYARWENGALQSWWGGPVRILQAATTGTGSQSCLVLLQDRTRVADWEQKDGPGNETEWTGGLLSTNEQSIKGQKTFRDVVRVAGNTDTATVVIDAESTSASTAYTSKNELFTASIVTSATSAVIQLSNSTAGTESGVGATADDLQAVISVTCAASGAVSLFSHSLGARGLLAGVTGPYLRLDADRITLTSGPIASPGRQCHLDVSGDVSVLLAGPDSLGWPSGELRRYRIARYETVDGAPTAVVKDGIDHDFGDLERPKVRGGIVIGYATVPQPPPPPPPPPFEFIDEG